MDGQQYELRGNGEIMLFTQIVLGHMFRDLGRALREFDWDEDFDWEGLETYAQGDREKTVEFYMRWMAAYMEANAEEVFDGTTSMPIEKLIGAALGAVMGRRG